MLHIHTQNSLCGIRSCPPIQNDDSLSCFLYWSFFYALAHPPLNQFVCYTISVGGHFPPKSNDDCLPCFLYKSFFFGAYIPNPMKFGSYSSWLQFNFEAIGSKSLRDHGPFVLSRTCSVCVTSYSFWRLFLSPILRVFYASMISLFLKPCVFLSIFNEKTF